MTMAYSVEEALQQQQQQQAAIYEETHFGNIGLGNALAVAYDLYNDSQSQSVQYSSYDNIDVDLYSIEKRHETTPTPQQQMNDIYSNNNSQLQSQYFYSNQQQMQQQQFFPENSIEVYSYLNPIPTSIPNQHQSSISSTSSGVFSNNNGYMNYGNGYLQVDHQNVMNQNFFQQPSNLQCNGQSSTSSSCVSPTSNNSVNDSNYTHQQQQQIIHQQQHQVVHQAQTQNHSTTSSTSGKTPKSSKGHGSSNSDDGVYEISEEEIQEIDDSLANNPEVIKSRHWKYYVETNEWTRATCALMACLFSREQMANSTVLGRGGAQRERLPTNLVAYVVTKIRRRFNRPAAAVRARMAQKCKDERRFGRLPSSKNGVNSQNGQGNSSNGGIGQKRQSNASSNNGGSKRLATKHNNTNNSTSNHQTAPSNSLHHSSGSPTSVMHQYALTDQSAMAPGDTNNNLISPNSNQAYSLNHQGTGTMILHSNDYNSLIFQNQNLDQYAPSHSPISSMNQAYLQHHQNQLYSMNPGNTNNNNTSQNSSSPSSTQQQQILLHGQMHLHKHNTHDVMLGKMNNSTENSPNPLTTTTDVTNNEMLLLSSVDDTYQTSLVQQTKQDSTA